MTNKTLSCSFQLFQLKVCPLDKSVSRWKPRRAPPSGEGSADPLGEGWGLGGVLQSQFRWSYSDWKRCVSHVMRLCQRSGLLCHVWVFYSVWRRRSAPLSCFLFKRTPSQLHLVFPLSDPHPRGKHALAHTDSHTLLWDSGGTLPTFTFILYELNVSACLSVCVCVRVT